MLLKPPARLESQRTKKKGVFLFNWWGKKQAPSWASRDERRGGCGPACVPYALLGLHRAWFGHQMLSEAFFSSALIVTFNFSAHQNYPNRCGVYLFDLK